MKTIQKIFTFGAIAILGALIGIWLGNRLLQEPPSRMEKIKAWVEKTEPTPRGFAPDINNRKFWNSRSESVKVETPPNLAEGDWSVGMLSDVLYAGTQQELAFNDGKWIPTIVAAVDLIQNTNWTEKIFENEFVDLQATAVAANLARTKVALGNKLPAETQEKIRNVVRKKVIGPFLNDYAQFNNRNIAWGKDMCPWLGSKTNWLAANLANITYAALAIEPDPKVRGEIAAIADSFVGSYLESFEADGYLSSGMRYWNFGFGNFLTLAERMKMATGGKVDYYENPHLKDIGFFRQKTLVWKEGDKEYYPLFADNENPIETEPWLVELCHLRFDTEPPQKTKPAKTSPQEDLRVTLPGVATLRAPRFQERESNFYKSAGFLIARGKDDITLAIKGGHNREEHNHNDIGSYTLFDREAYITGDVGAKVYELSDFGRTRYEIPMFSSWGHPVPVVDNHLQHNSPEALAKVVAFETSFKEDQIEYDLTACYKTEGLKKLTRKVTIKKYPETIVTITDSFECDREIPFETAIITLAQPKIEKNTIQWAGFQATTGGEIKIKRQSFLGDTQVRRTALSLPNPAKSGAITYTLRKSPEQKKETPSATPPVKIPPRTVRP